MNGSLFLDAIEPLGYNVAPLECVYHKSPPGGRGAVGSRSK